MARPGDFPHRPRARTPVFYGGFDWHSAVGMHWQCLNASRAWAWRRIAESLPDGDPRVAPASAAARAHSDAALPHALSEDYLVGHWLPCYAVLFLS